MRIVLSVFIFYFSSILTGLGQKLTAEETIKVLQTAKQSVEVIDFVVQGDFTFLEINQTNQLKTKGLKDDVILYVLKTHAKLTDAEIDDLLGYQQQGLPQSVINKTIDEKPKYVEALKEKAKSYPVQTKYRSDNLEPLDSKKITYQETIGIELSKEKIIEGAKKWLDKYRVKSKIIEIKNDTTLNVVCKHFLEPEFDVAMGMMANEPKATFDVEFTCSDGYYTYRVSNIIMAYYYGNEPTNSTESPIEKMKGYGVLGKLKKDFHQKTVQMINDINTFVID